MGEFKRLPGQAMAEDRKRVRVQGGRLLKSHPSEDLETALKALKIAGGSLEEAAEHYE